METIPEFRTAQEAQVTREPQPTGCVRDATGCVCLAMAMSLQPAAYRGIITPSRIKGNIYYIFNEIEFSLWSVTVPVKQNDFFFQSKKVVKVAK